MYFSWNNKYNDTFLSDNQKTLGGNCMRWYLVLIIFIVILGAFTTAYQVYKLTEIDARCRELKHPRLWGLFSLSGKGSEGLILYLIGRRRFPSSASEAERAEMESRKKKAGVSLVFLALGAIALFTILILKY